MGLKRLIPVSKLERFLQLKAAESKVKTELENISKFIMESFDSDKATKEVIDIDGIEVMKYASGVNTPAFDEETAAKVLDTKGLRSLATVMVPVISQDKVKEMIASGLLTVEEYNGMLKYKIIPKLKIEDKREVQAVDVDDVIKVI